ncbi:hypothetical protein Angca_001251, partial [Angiostrongylus cantonensis]
FPRKSFKEVEEHMQRRLSSRDGPFWREAPLHRLKDMEADLDGATAAWMAEVSLTRTEYIG